MRVCPCLGAWAGECGDAAFHREPGATRESVLQVVGPTCWVRSVHIHFPVPPLPRAGRGEGFCFTPVSVGSVAQATYTCIPQKSPRAVVANALHISWGEARLCRLGGFYFVASLDSTTLSSRVFVRWTQTDPPRSELPYLSPSRGKDPVFM